MTCLKVGKGDHEGASTEIVRDRCDPRASMDINAHRLTSPMIIVGRPASLIPRSREPIAHLYISASHALIRTCNHVYLQQVSQCEDDRAPCNTPTMAE